MARRLGRAVAAALVAVIGFGAMLETGVASADPGVEQTFVAKLNEFRAARGLSQLRVREDLAGVARSWAQSMRARGDIAHNPDLTRQAPADWDRVGENVGVGGDVQELHDAWVASPTHVRQMLDDRFDAVGVGVVRAPEGAMYVTVNFMTTRQAPAAAPAPAGGSSASAAPAASCAKNRKGRCTSRRTARRSAPARRARVARR